MSDEAEQASALESLVRNAGISAVAKNMNSRTESLTHCLECGDPIPDKRREAFPGIELCLVCKSEEEKEGKRGFWS